MSCLKLSVFLAVVAAFSLFWPWSDAMYYSPVISALTGFLFFLGNMIQNCNYNPLSDIEEVVPSLSVDAAEIMASGVVPSTADTTPYTKETEISEVGHYLKDKIQTAIAAIHLQRSMSAQVKSGNTGASSQPATPAEKA